MSDDGKSPLVEAMERAKRQREGYVPEGGPLDRIHAMLPDWLSARAAVMRKRKQMRDLDAATAEAPIPEDGQR